MKKPAYGGEAEAERLRKIHGGGKVSTLAENPQGPAEDGGAIPPLSTNLTHEEHTGDCACHDFYDC